jgi:hypothetical protein
MPDIKLTFIQNTLREFLQRVQAAMESSGHQKKIDINSISHKILENGGGALGQLSFNDYLRFVDMGVGRGHPLGGLTATSVALQSSNKTGLAQVKDKTRKPKKIYAKPAYGELGFLYGKLLYGFTEETIAALKEEMENQNNLSS